jgi:hypothetical protein
MPARSPPQAALCGRDRPLPALAPGIDCCGSERFIRKALAPQSGCGLYVAVAADGEIDASVGAEEESP